MPASRPLGTGRDSFPSSGSGIPGRLSRDAVGAVSSLPIVNLTVAMTVEQFQVVHRVRSSVTTPVPMMDVPGFLAGSQRLATTHAPAFLCPP